MQDGLEFTLILLPNSSVPLPTDLPVISLIFPHLEDGKSVISHRMHKHIRESLFKWMKITGYEVCGNQLNLNTGQYRDHQRGDIYKAFQRPGKKRDPVHQRRPGKMVKEQAVSCLRK